MPHNHRIVPYQAPARTFIIQNQERQKKQIPFIKFSHSAHKVEYGILMCPPMYILTGIILIIAELIRSMNQQRCQLGSTGW